MPQGQINSPEVEIVSLCPPRPYLRSEMKQLITKK